MNLVCRWLMLTPMADCASSACRTASSRGSSCPKVPISEVVEANRLVSSGTTICNGRLFAMVSDAIVVDFAGLMSWASGSYVWDDVCVGRMLLTTSGDTMSGLNRHGHD